ncbi:MAG: hypothetical protein ACO1RA_07560 [Planctomycetaceae bacterium]
MAMFVHLTKESNVAKIRRNGIGRMRRSHGDVPRGVFATPVVRNFFITHQWLRELKRGRNEMLWGVYFRIHDSEKVYVGHYNQAHQWLTAAEAVAVIDAAEDARGWEVIIPRTIAANEIHRTHSLPQNVGWRYFPQSHGTKPCACRYCSRGEYGSASLRRRLGEDD